MLMPYRNKQVKVEGTLFTYFKIKFIGVNKRAQVQEPKRNGSLRFTK